MGRCEGTAVAEVVRSLVERGVRQHTRRARGPLAECPDDDPMAQNVK